MTLTLPQDENLRGAILAYVSLGLLPIPTSARIITSVAAPVAIRSTIVMVVSCRRPSKLSVVTALRRRSVSSSSSSPVSSVASSMVPSVIAPVTAAVRVPEAVPPAAGVRWRWRWRIPVPEPGKSRWRRYPSRRWSLGRRRVRIITVLMRRPA
ncbi:hypothetical protein GGS23DRAFT_115653 [Durotheca rogersii]|uniref:uncharacterized protein n=1 Tax=Durotheca rogersii TaxID=419775 RepID=UPI00221E4709|nr:uncharacterized protein GGS23DRAFT_115653 [Durotheca rogersii]KAI5862274.1 hypothetical protein GGS23DRAFT_115653 [Durotheca rogersii]